MLKKTSILIIFVAGALTSCSTTRFSDVAPETAGTQLGSVPIGKENVDFFVIPDPAGQSTPYTFLVNGDDEYPEPASIVVFKTRERHPVHRTLDGFAVPGRMIDGAMNNALDRAKNLAHTWVHGSRGNQESKNQPEPQAQPEIPYRPETQPVQPEERQPRVYTRDDIFVKPAVTTAGIANPQDNRNRG